MGALQQTMGAFQLTLALYLMEFHSNWTQSFKFQLSKITEVETKEHCFCFALCFSISRILKKPQYKIFFIRFKGNNFFFRFTYADHNWWFSGMEDKFSMNKCIHRITKTFETTWVIVLGKCISVGTKKCTLVPKCTIHSRSDQEFRVSIQESIPNQIKSSGWIKRWQKKQN